LPIGLDAMVGMVFSTGSSGLAIRSFPIEEYSGTGVIFLPMVT